MTITPAPAPGGPAPLDDATRDRLADLARARGRLWAGAADLLAGSPTVGEHLRSGGVPAPWRAGTAPFAGQTPSADQALLVLEAHARAARRRPAEHDARALADAYSRVALPSADDAHAARRVADLCAREAAAWADGDMDGARAARVAQVPIVSGRLHDRLWTVGYALAQTGRPVWRALGTLVQTFVAVERGR
ncbi:hypothetical protein KQI48_06845 [Cellulomonas hominis]|uniref:hypothetical protein n=1 Tax=Cellulomonas hominis TaxID=156981 RepID=UPI001C101B0C|nr:hypothetical protein [Cellulomonas hominis]MBU5422377.1 hypothetical protein [Cellulomonas hominis]